MPSVAQRPSGSKVGGVLPALLEVALSFGVYYLLRAFGVGVFWALTTPAIAVAVVTLVMTGRRRRVDMIGLLVLFELAATLALSLVTRSARVAAVREPVYIFIGGAFCLATLFYRTPFSHVSTSTMAIFGDPKREAAFERAWRDVPRYRRWQRLITASLGLIMVVAAMIRAYLVFSAPAVRIPHAVDVSNVVGLVMIAALVVVSAILIQVPRRIIEDLLDQMQSPVGTAELRDGNRGTGRHPTGAGRRTGRPSA
jgi:hypothetical protein